MWTSGLTNVLSRPMLTLAAGAIAIALLQHAWISSGRELVGIVNVALIVLTCLVIGMGVWDQGAVNAQTVLGVLTIYLLIGALYAFAFSAAAQICSAPLFAQGTDGTMAARGHFSDGTRAPPGYGDSTPAGTTAQMMAVSEALLGQIYLVTVVALVISRLRTRE